MLLTKIPKWPSWADTCVSRVSAKLGGAVSAVEEVTPKKELSEIEAKYLLSGGIKTIGVPSRAYAGGLVAGACLLVADAERMPVPDRAVDRVSIAFGLRNCTDKAAVLAEGRRVLRPGGQFSCLELRR